MPMNRRPEPIRLPLAGAAGLSLAAAWVTCLTVTLNPHLTVGARLRLTVLFVFTAAAAGTLLGLAASLLPVLARRLGASPASERRLSAALLGLLAFGPPLYALLLPDTGLAGHLLTDALFTPGFARRALTLLALTALLAAAGLATTALLRRLHRAVPAAAWTVLLATVVTLLLLAPSEARQRTGPQPAEPQLASTNRPPSTPPDEPSPTLPPTRVVLLVVDGADLQVIEPMVEAGELPTFARLTRQGTWGPLATIEPTLSPLVWTTIATGKPPAEHGVLHFTWFRLPWVGQPILTFPLHTGLNFRLFPWLEKLPGPPAERLPYSSGMRRSEALWTIVGRRHPVGVFHWLVTWPAEEVPGFVVAGGFGAVQHSDVEAVDDRRAFQPRRLADERAPRHRVSDDELRRYAGPGVALDRGDPHVRYVARTAGNGSGRLLASLVARFEPRLVAAGFYPVDGYHHHFAAARRDGGPFAPAIAERYRLTDRRLGELMESLAELPGETNLVVVSDHGFDFEHGHHTWSPPGVVFAHGPAFTAGRRVDDLTVYDVAPLVLHLTGMPVPLDMPSGESGAYRAALSGDWLRQHPVDRVATYEGSGDGPLHGDESPLDDQIREQLKSLGYIR